MDAVPDDIRRELSPGEQAVWWGRPRQGLVLQASDALLVPFSVMWCGFALFWEWLAVSNGHWFLVLWGIPFVAIGLYIVAGRFAADARRRARTLYALTSDRAIIVTGHFGRQVTSLQLAAIRDLTLSEGSTGEGTIAFGSSPFATVAARMPGWPGAADYLGPRFERIPRAREVYETIRQAQRTAR